MSEGQELTFTVLFQNTGEEKTFTINGTKPIEIGRQTAAGEVGTSHFIKFDSRVISRKHAEFQLVENKLCIRDTKSSSGTYINGKRLSPQGMFSDYIEIFPTDDINFGEDCVVDGTSYKAVSIKVILPQSQGTPPMPALVPLQTVAPKTKIMKPGGSISSLTSSQWDAKSDNNSVRDDNQEMYHADVDVEFDAIWQGINQGLEPHVRKYLLIAQPYTKNLVGAGAFDTLQTSVSLEFSKADLLGKKSGSGNIGQKKKVILY
ncbi:hypothetical protein HDV04_000738 [Boothiomyces sp. JEL0838]|nr:hypothetical protein HDV04_000738 [Boothiomyces sp. JEL0838]